MLRSNIARIPFRGRSMWPLLGGDETLLVDIPQDPIHLTAKDVGLLFIFRDHSEWVCHRYLGQINNQHIFKGDFSTTYEFIESPHVLGRVRGFETANKQMALLDKSIFDNLMTHLQTRFVRSRTPLKKLYRYLALVLLYFKKRFLKLK